MDGLDRAVALKFRSIEASSRDLYKQSLRTIQDLTGMDESTVLVKADPSTVIETIEHKVPGLQLKRNLVNAIIAIYKWNPNLAPDGHLAVWKAYVKKLSGEVDARYDSNDLSERQLAGYMKWSDVIVKRKAMQDKDLMAFLLVAMYTMRAPARSDYGQVRILEWEPVSSAHQNEGNYIVIRPDYVRLVCNVFKTVKKLGRYDTILDKQLEALIKKSLLAHPRRWLFVPRACHTNDNKGDSKDKPFPTRDSFNAFANKVLRDNIGKGMTITQLRHSCINHNLRKLLSITSRKKLAADMMHTFSMQARYQGIQRDDEEHVTFD